MLVSAKSSNSSQIILSSTIKAKATGKTDKDSLVSNPKKESSMPNQDKIFDVINEWKNFCHHQIEQGKFDIIA
jgi:hypothetical protein